MRHIYIDLLLSPTRSVLFQFLTGKGAVDFTAHQFADVTRDPLTQGTLKLLADDLGDQIAQGVFVQHLIVTVHEIVVVKHAGVIGGSGGQRVIAGGLFDGDSRLRLARQALGFGLCLGSIGDIIAGEVVGCEIFPWQRIDRAAGIGIGGIAIRLPLVGASGDSRFKFGHARPEFARPVDNSVVGGGMKRRVVMAGFGQIARIILHLLPVIITRRIGVIVAPVRGVDIGRCCGPRTVMASIAMVSIVVIRIILLIVMQGSAIPCVIRVRGGLCRIIAVIAVGRGTIIHPQRRRQHQTRRFARLFSLGAGGNGGCRYAVFIRDQPANRRQDILDFDVCHGI